MASISKNGIITMNAGDYFKYPLFINAGSVMEPLRYILENDDKVLFSIMEPNQPFEHGILRKIYTKENLNVWGDVEVEFDSTDTENLLPGTYYYEVKLLINKDNKTCVSTVVPKKKFYVME